MIKYLSLILTFSFFACTEKKSKNQLLLSNPQPQIKSEIEIKRERMNIAQIGNPAPLATLLTKDSTSTTTKKFEGKLLVIDFWATYCSPCISETPIFKELEKKYENENVEFITVSVDGEFNYWKEYITENQWSSDNYWLGMKETEPLFSFMYSEMEIKGEKTVLIGLPKYVIISPKGIILNNQAPKPSDPQFEDKLKDLIKAHTS